MHIVIGSDHAGYRLKEHLKDVMKADGHTVDDLGTHSEEPVDYPPICADVARAVGLLLAADPAKIAGQAFNCYDRYISEYEVAEIARRLSGSRSKIDGAPSAPKHQIVVARLEALGMRFGGLPLLEATVKQLLG